VFINFQVSFVFPFVYIDHFSGILAVVFITVVLIVVMLVIIVGTVILIVVRVFVHLIVRVFVPLIMADAVEIEIFTLSMCNE